MGIKNQRECKGALPGAFCSRDNVVHMSHRPPFQCITFERKNIVKILSGNPIHLMMNFNLFRLVYVAVLRELADSLSEDFNTEAHITIFAARDRYSFRRSST
ncbi:peroxisomal enoyl-coa hydratase, putative [Leishmania tarentolae]|uniref:Peroxisomal enoyl-coa hydratase, putative n=1 Tax=Leishmania tarentolae TaxID=5689 RepID=A0A640KDJ6_LEITA|nr:peroxisomal enoyl-coa hydratase, putative [Leishmania tarentolae]